MPGVNCLGAQLRAVFGVGFAGAVVNYPGVLVIAAEPALSALKVVAIKAWLLVSVALSVVPAPSVAVMVLSAAVMVLSAAVMVLSAAVAMNWEGKALMKAGVKTASLKNAISLKAATPSNAKKFSDCMYSLGLPEWLVSIKCDWTGSWDDRKRVLAKVKTFLHEWEKEVGGEFGWVMVDDHGREHLRINVAVFDPEGRLGQIEISKFAKRYFDNASVYPYDDSFPDARAISAALRSNVDNVCFGGVSCDLLFLPHFRVYVYGVGANAIATAGYSWLNETVGMKRVKWINAPTRKQGTYVGLLSALKILPRNAKVEVFLSSKQMVAECNNTPTTNQKNGLGRLREALRKVIAERGLKVKFTWVPRKENLAGKLL